MSLLFHSQFIILCEYIFWYYPCVVVTTQNPTAHRFYIHPAIISVCSIFLVSVCKRRVTWQFPKTMFSVYSWLSLPIVLDMVHLAIYNQKKIRERTVIDLYVLLNGFNWLYNYIFSQKQKVKWHFVYLINLQTKINNSKKSVSFRVLCWRWRCIVIYVEEFNW